MSPIIIGQFRSVEIVDQGQDPIAWGTVEPAIGHRLTGQRRALRRTGT